MSNLEQNKAKRREELLATLELKKKALQEHLDEGANKAINVGKGIIVAGTGLLLIYAIFDRYLESKFKPQKEQSTSSLTKSSVNNLLLPLLSILVQQGTHTLFELGKKKLINYLNTRNQKDERLSESISKK